MNEHLVTNRFPISTLHILKNTNNGPNKHQNAGRVQGIHVFPLKRVSSHTLHSRMRSQSPLEHNRAYQEEAEDEHLHDEAFNNNILASAGRVTAPRAIR